MPGDSNRPGILYVMGWPTDIIVRTDLDAATQFWNLSLLQPAGRKAQRPHLTEIIPEFHTYRIDI